MDKVWYNRLNYKNHAINCIEYTIGRSAMIPKELHDLISGGENLNVEFKKSQTDITKDVYESVCAFSNREG